MIVIDSSALIAVMLAEPDGEFFRTRMGTNERLSMSAVNAHETAAVLQARFGSDLVADFWRLLSDLHIEIVAFDEPQVRVAAEAYARYGKGLGTKAQLNLCDCAAYALARTLDAPLLFKGDDFPHTDVVRCV